MNNSNQSASLHNIAEFHQLIKSFLTNDLDNVQDVLMSALADHVGNDEYDANYRRQATQTIGDVIAFISKLEARYSFLTKEYKEVCHA